MSAFSGPALLSIKFSWDYSPLWFSKHRAEFGVWYYNSVQCSNNLAQAPSQVNIALDTESSKAATSWQNQDGEWVKQG